MLPNVELVVGSAVVGSSVFGSAVEGLSVDSSAVVGSTVVGTAVVGSFVLGSAVEGLSVDTSAVVGLQTSFDMQTVSNFSAPQQSCKLSKYTISSTLSGMSYPLVHCFFSSLSINMYHLRSSHGVGAVVTSSGINGVGLVAGLSVGLIDGFSVLVGEGLGFDGSVVGPDCHIGLLLDCHIGLLLDPHNVLPGEVQGDAQLSVGGSVAGDSHKSLVGEDHGDDQSKVSGWLEDFDLDPLLDDLDCPMLERTSLSPTLYS